MFLQFTLMQASYQWINYYLPFKINANKIDLRSLKTLTLCGFWAPFTQLLLTILFELSYLLIQ